MNLVFFSLRLYSEDREERERGRTARAARHGEIEDAVRDGEGDL